MHTLFNFISAISMSIGCLNIDSQTPHNMHYTLLYLLLFDYTMGKKFTPSDDAIYIHGFLKVIFLFINYIDLRFSSYIRGEG